MDRIRATLRTPMARLSPPLRGGAASCVGRMGVLWFCLTAMTLTLRWPAAAQRSTACNDAHFLPYFSTCISAITGRSLRGFLRAVVALLRLTLVLVCANHGAIRTPSYRRDKQLR